MAKPIEQIRVIRRKQGALIRFHRKTLDMTLQQVGNGLGVSKDAVSQWEKGLTSPTTPNQIALARILQVPWIDIFGLDDADVA